MEFYDDSWNYRLKLSGWREKGKEKRENRKCQKWYKHKSKFAGSMVKNEAQNKLCFSGKHHATTAIDFKDCLIGCSYTWNRPFIYEYQNYTNLLACWNQQLHINFKSNPQSINVDQTHMTKIEQWHAHLNINVWPACLRIFSRKVS